MRLLALLHATSLVLCVCAQTAPRSAPAALPSYKELQFPPLRPVTIPDVLTVSLPNGMKLYLLEDHELPIVSGVALIRTGNLFDPPDKIGLATVTGIVLRSGGTKNKTGDQLDEQLENIAASVESQIGETNGQISFSALKENTDEVLKVFQELIMAPEFRQDKIDLVKTQLRSSISRRNDDAHGIAGREFSDIVYGRDTPYGWRMEYEHVDRIGRDDVLAFYKRYLFPANIMLGVRGDFYASEMKAKLETLFSGWQYRQPAVPPFPIVRAKPAPGVYLAKKDDVTQTFFEMGHLGGTLRDKDYPALEVMADILGGGFRSRLFQRVRTQLGFAYGISSNWGANYNHPGLLEISGSTKSPSTTETIKVIQEEIEKIRATEVSSEELDTARQTVANSFVFNFDTKAKTLNRILIYEYYGYPKDFIYQYQKAVAAVTKADILRVAREHLKPREMTIVAVGKPEDFGQPLATLGYPVTSIDLSIPEGEPQASAKADATSLERGRQLLRRVQQAVGGADKLAAVRDVMQVAEIQVEQGGGVMKAKQTNKWVAPSHFRQEIDLPFGKISSYSDGNSGWIVTPQGAGPLPAAELKQVQGELFRNYFTLLLSDRNPERMVNFLGEGALEISDKQGNSVRLTVDEKTALPLKESYQSMAAVEEDYSELKEVEGIRMPHKITIHQGGRKFADIIVLDSRLNSGLNPEDLSKRP